MFPIKYVFVFVYSTYLFSEPWPISPFYSQHQINGTFGECRSKTVDDTLRERHHLHDGVDIQASNNTSVYPTLSGIVDYCGSNWVRTKFTEGEDIYYTEYWHLKDIEVSNDDNVVASTTLLGKTDTLNHVHFISGKRDVSVWNPLYTLYPYEDTDYPVFPIMDGIRVIRDIDASTPDNAILENLSGGLLEGDIVDIIVDVHDENGSSNNLGIYCVQVEIFPPNSSTSIYDRDFIFSDWGSAWNPDPMLIYAPGSNTSKYIYNITNRETSNSNFNTSGLDEGTYRIAITAYDIYYIEIDYPYNIWCNPNSMSLYIPIDASPMQEKYTKRNQK